MNDITISQSGDRRRGRPVKDENASSKLADCLSVWRYADGEEFIELRTRLGRGAGAQLVKERFWPTYCGSFARARKAAEDRLLEIKHARLHGVDILHTARARSMTMRELLGDLDADPVVRGEYFTKHALAAYDPSTVHGYEWSLKTYILPAFGRRNLRDIRTRDINDFKTYLQNPASHGGLGLAPSTTAKILTALGSVLTYALSRGYIGEHPMQQKKVKYPSGGQRDAIDPKHPLTVERVCAQMTFRRACFVRTVAYELLRTQEALALCYGDFIDETGKLRTHLIVNKAIKPDTPPPVSPIGPLKTHRHNGSANKQIRYPQLWTAIGEDIYRLWDEDGFPSLETIIWPVEKGPHKGQPWRTPTMWGQSHWKTACRKAGVRYDNIYDLRHLGATLLMIGPRWDFKRIADFMGNSARVCEERYSHLADWADEFKGMEMNEILRTVRTQPAAAFERKLRLITGQPKTASEIVRELAG